MRWTRLDFVPPLPFAPLENCLVHCQGEVLISVPSGISAIQSGIACILGPLLRLLGHGARARLGEEGVGGLKSGRGRGRRADGQTGCAPLPKQHAEVLLELFVSRTGPDGVDTRRRRDS